MSHSWLATHEAERSHRPTTRRQSGPLTAVGMFGLVVTWAFIWLAFFAVAPAALGWRPVVVTSGSMLPAIRAGDVIVARPHSGVGLAPGTVVVFDPGDGRGSMTHRISAAHADGTYTTAGDANAAPDSTRVRPDQVIGVGALRVPFVGLPVLWLHDGSWDRVLAVLALLAVAVRVSPLGSARPPAAGGERRRRVPATGPAAFRPARPRSALTVRVSTLGMLLVIIGMLTVGAARGAFADAAASADNTVTSWRFLHDVAITDLRAPETAKPNATVTIEVDVANLGTEAATFEVQLRDLTKGTTIGTEAVDLASETSTTLFFAWTPGGPQNIRLLEAEAIFAPDEDPANNVAATTVTVTNK